MFGFGFTYCYIFQWPAMQLMTRHVAVFSRLLDDCLEFQVRLFWISKVACKKLTHKHKLHTTHRLRQRCWDRPEAWLLRGNTRAGPC